MPRIDAEVLPIVNRPKNFIVPARPPAGIVDQVVPEPEGGAHTDHEVGAGLLGTALTRHLAELKSFSIDDLVAVRQRKFRNIAQFYTEG